MFIRTQAFSFFFLVSLFGLFGQIQIPRLSPLQTIKQRVGITDIEVNYSRPSKRDRVIFGELVSYNEIWRTGANINSTISFSNDVTIGHIKVKAGKYGLYTKPRQGDWDIYLYAENNNWGNRVVWDDDKVVAKITTPVLIVDESQELFTIAFNTLTAEETHLSLSWDKVRVSFPIIVHTNEKVLQAINKTLSSDHATANDFYISAVYYLNSNQKLLKGLELLDKAIALAPDRYSIYNMKGNFFFVLKRKQEGIEVVQKSLAMAIKKGDKVYISENKRLLKELNKL